MTKYDVSAGSAVNQKNFGKKFLWDFFPKLMGTELMWLWDEKVRWNGNTTIFESIDFCLVWGPINKTLWGARDTTQSSKNRKLQIRQFFVSSLKINTYIYFFLKDNIAFFCEKNVNCHLMKITVYYIIHLNWLYVIYVVYTYYLPCILLHSCKSFIVQQR